MLRTVPPMTCPIRVDPIGGGRHFAAMVCSAATWVLRLAAETQSYATSRGVVEAEPGRARLVLSTARATVQQERLESRISLQYDSRMMGISMTGISTDRRHSTILKPCVGLAGSPR